MKNKAIEQKLDELYQGFLNKKYSEKKYEKAKEILIGEYKINKNVEAVSTETLLKEVDRRNKLGLLEASGWKIKTNYETEIPISEESYQKWAKGLSIDFEGKSCSKCNQPIDYKEEGGCFHKETWKLYCKPCGIKEKGGELLKKEEAKWLKT